MNAVVVQGLHKSFARQPVLTGVDLEVVEGSFTAILGASGSGKTTLLRVIAGFERADRGKVFVAGVLVDDATRVTAPERRRIGYVAQEGSLFPHLTAAENVAFGLDREQRREGRVERYLDMVGIAALGERYPHELSGGQQQRVAIARALVIEPAVVLLDEPFSSLDASLRASVRADVRSVLAAADATTILVTHDQDEALSMADQVAVLRDGAIVQAGSPEALYTQPRDIALAQFLGEANLLPAVVEGSSASTSLGVLELASPSLSSARHAVVLLRPEQIELSTDGTSGTVVACEYYGHDAVLSVKVGDQTVLTRVPGDQALAVGAVVRLRARGPVTAWEVGVTGSA